MQQLRCERREQLLHTREQLYFHPREICARLLRRRLAGRRHFYSSRRRYRGCCLTLRAARRRDRTLLRDLVATITVVVAQTCHCDWNRHFPSPLNILFRAFGHRCILRRPPFALYKNLSRQLSSILSLHSPTLPHFLGMQVVHLPLYSRSNPAATT